MRLIKHSPIRKTTVQVPGSKSYSHRMAIAAALAPGTSEIHNLLQSEDIDHTLSALGQLGAQISRSNGTATVTGIPQNAAGRIQPPAPSSPIHIGNSGTTMRLMTAVAALGPGPYRLSGTSRMHERPIGELLDALSQLGVNAFSIHDNNCPPVEIQGPLTTGGRVDIDCTVSSQYLSALLLIAPCLEGGLEINVTNSLVSKPYVDMTIDVMNRFGIPVRRESDRCFRVTGPRAYAPGAYTVEPDASQAGYFWAAGAITGVSVTVSGLSRKSRQGDVGFAGVLESMGCRIQETPSGITVSRDPGTRLRPVTVDMADMPDLVPTLAVVAAFANGETIIENVAHLAAKESDRLAAVAGELTKMGISVQKTKDGLAVTGGTPRGADIETYDDHRIAMSFAIAGLAVPGVRIADPACVEKSFPGFWETLEELYQQ